jgi:hypothetical protein
MKSKCLWRLAIIVAMVFVITFGTTVQLKAEPVDINIGVRINALTVSCLGTTGETILWEEWASDYATYIALSSNDFVWKSPIGVTCPPDPPYVVSFRVFTSSPGKDDWINEVAVPVTADRTQDQFLFNFTKESDTAFMSVDHIYFSTGGDIRALIVGKPLAEKVK